MCFTLLMIVSFAASVLLDNRRITFTEAEYLYERSAGLYMFYGFPIDVVTIFILIGMIGK